MLVSKEWLDEFVKVDVSVEELAEKITRSGIEVEDITHYDKDIKNLVVGYVTEKVKHPEADKLNICQVNIGDETLQIVCGAPNVDVGQYVLVSRVGGRLPGGIKIKRAKLRGETSEGMICSLSEMGIPKNLIPERYAEGIYNFPSEVKPGTDGLEALFMHDSVMEFELTPNRSDAMSVLGSAYEVSALYEEQLTYPTVTINESGKASEALTVTVEDKNASPYYGARIVKNVQIAESPAWMQSRLIKSGVRPINNVVDISNYVMLELGQPLHMFDQDKIGSNHITVRYAKTGEVMTTLDNVKRTLNEEDIVVTNGNEPIALAGVMGGNFSEVTDKTTNIVIESAMFNPVNVRKTSKTIGLRSEASSRFEKGVAAERVQLALNRAAHLLEELAQGQVLSGVVSDGQLPELITTIEITTSQINNYIGFNISPSEIKNIFERLGFDTQVDGESFNVHVPSRRSDITIKEDLIEEVARIYGYDALPSTLPTTKPNGSVGLTPYQQKRRAIKHMLAGMGVHQAITYALVSKEKSQQFTDGHHETVKLLMPMSEDHAELRQSLVPHLIDALQYNNARQMKDVALFEIGNTFYGKGNQQPEEVEKLAVVMTGNYNETSWQGKQEPVDFYVVKGILEALANELQVTLSFERSNIKELHPGRSANVLLDNKIIGFIGQLHPTVESAHDLKETYVFEVNLRDLLSQNRAIQYNTIPKFPGISYDIALEVERSMETGELIRAIESLKHPLLVDAFVFDIYEGEHIAKYKKSVAIRLEFLNREQTLTDKDIKPIVDEVVSLLVAQGAKLRG